MSVGPAILPSVFWLGGAVRFGAARSSVVQRALCGALLCFAGALTLHLTPIYVSFDHAVGVSNLADLATDILALLGAALLLDVSREIANPAQAKLARRRTYVLAGVAILTSATLFATASVPVETVDFGQTYGGIPQVAAYCVVDIAYFELCLLELVRLSLAYRKRVPRRSIRVGLRLVGVGTAIGLVYSVVIYAELATELAAARSSVVDGTANLGHALLMLGGTVVGLGLLIPGAAGVATRTRRRITAVVALCRLRRVWLCVTGAAPHVVLGERPSRMSDVLAARPELRLLGRMVEIRDAMLALKPYASDEDVAAARFAAEQRHASGAARVAAESASWLRSAIAAKRDGAVPRGQPASAAVHTEEVEDEHVFARALAGEWAATIADPNDCAISRTNPQAQSWPSSAASASSSVPT